MNNIPITYQQQMLYNFHGVVPYDVAGQDNLSIEAYKWILYNKLNAVFKFKLPKLWKLNWFRYWLFRFGSIGAIYTNKYGWIVQPYSVSKLDFQYNPAEIRVTNSYLQDTYIGRIGVNACIIKCFDDFASFDSIVTRYAEMLALAEKDININFMNVNSAYLFEAENKKKSQELQTAFDDASRGKPLVVINENVLKGKDFKPFIPNLKERFLVTDLLEARRGIINAFLTDIGIRNVSVQKKERLTQGETNENNDETRAIADVVLENLQDSFKEFTKLSGLEASVSLRYPFTTNQNVSRETSQAKEVK